MIANEVLDAVPAALVARRDGEWRERGRRHRCRTMRAWRFRLERTLRPMRASLRWRPRAFRPMSTTTSEINPAAEALVEDIGRRMTGGAALFIDYGFPAAEYYHPQRSEGTLMCHYRHRAHGDPFAWPGLRDITAHVDFTRDRRSGRAGGPRGRGLHAQAPFLIGCGILDALAAAGAPESAAYIRAAASVQKLLAPAEMGELFKVLALTKSETIAWRGFGIVDRRHRL